MYVIFRTQSNCPAPLSQQLTVDMTEEDVSQEMSQDNEVELDTPSLCSTPTSSSSSTLPVKRRRTSTSKQLKSDDNVLDVALSEYLKGKAQQKEIDEDEHFLMSLLGPLKRMSQKNRSYAKLKMQELMYKLESNEEQPCVSSEQIQVESQGPEELSFSSL